VNCIIFCRDCKQSEPFHKSCLFHSQRKVRPASAQAKTVKRICFLDSSSVQIVAVAYGSMSIQTTQPSDSFIAPITKALVTERVRTGIISEWSFWNKWSCGSNASLLLAKGVDMKLIQSWLGHAHYSTTADIYAKLRVDAKHGLGAVLSGEFASSP